MNVCILFILLNGSAYITPVCYNDSGYFDEPSTVVYTQHFPQEYEFLYESPDYYLDTYLTMQREYCDELDRIGKYDLTCYPQHFSVSWQRISPFERRHYRPIPHHLRLRLRKNRWIGKQRYYLAQKPHAYRHKYYKHGHKHKTYKHKTYKHKTYKHKTYKHKTYKHKTYKHKTYKHSNPRYKNKYKKPQHRTSPRKSRPNSRKKHHYKNRGRRR